MKKILTLAGVFIILFSISYLFIQSKSAKQTKTKEKIDFADLLTKGKWMNKSGGYKISNESDNTTERFKTFQFNIDGTFELDSAKQKYNGTWSLNENNIYLIFKTKKITHLYRNNNPNKSSTDYSTVTEEVKLPDRQGIISENQLNLSDGFKYKHYSEALSGLFNFYEFSGFANVQWGHIIMIFAGLFFIFLAIKFDYEPLLLIPIGVGILIGNIPMFQVADFNLKLGIYEPGSVMNILYQGVTKGWYPPLIFLGIGAMTDFSSLISSPRLMLLGAAAQLGIFATFLGALYLGFAPQEAGAIGIIG
ncbi:MAG: sodium ion-translocating decarboxylase subunit beta, partial [Bacteroidales bacterium]|nr:sodium ion-translocating decarboxylase subunit beta [Bacteroidales bacterium]